MALNTVRVLSPKQVSILIERGSGSLGIKLTSLKCFLEDC